jgi:hypothetical protein
MMMLFMEIPPCVTSRSITAPLRLLASAAPSDENISYGPARNGDFSEQLSILTTFRRSVNDDAGSTLHVGIQTGKPGGYSERRLP